MLDYCKFTKRNQKFTKRKPKSAIILHVEFSIMQPIIGTRLKELRETKKFEAGTGGGDLLRQQECNISVRKRDAATVAGYVIQLFRVAL